MLIFLIIIYFSYYWHPLLEHVLLFVQPTNPLKFNIDLFSHKNLFFIRRKFLSARPNVRGSLRK